jgi:hypothetical protein
VYVRLLQLAGRNDELEATIQSSLDQALASQDLHHLQESARIFDELGRFDAFERKVREALPRNRAERFLRSLPAHPHMARLAYPPSQEILF